MRIYKTTNIINGMIYVGQDASHRSNYLGSGVLLCRAIKKYGRENFEKEVLAWCYTKEHLDFLEKFYIQSLNTRVPTGYNLTGGGDGGGINPSVETRLKMRVARIGKKYPKMGLAHIGKPSWIKGRHHTDEAKRKNSEAHLGRLSWMKGNHHSVEARIKMRLSRLGKFSGENNPSFGVHPGEETREKMSVAKKGIKLSDEHREKISVSMKSFWERTRNG